MTDGYFSGVDYMYAYQAELNPLRMRMGLLRAGFEPPAVVNACELGFGQGISANVHAASSTTGWWGADYNATQAAFAQELATVSGARTQLSGQSFAEFCTRTDLPDFDFIAMHGIWTWISPDNQVLLTDFLRRKLRVGGVLYISYNAQPGFVAIAPIQELLYRHAAARAAATPVRERVRDALDFVGRLVAASPMYTQAHPAAAQSLRALNSRGLDYVAHEYFGSDWAPISFARLCDSLRPCGLEFACSAPLFDGWEEWNFTAAQRALLAQVEDRELRQTVQDFMLDRPYHEDYWVRGARRISRVERLEALYAVPIQLIRHGQDVLDRLQPMLREHAPPTPLSQSLMDHLSDHRARTLRELASAPGGAGTSFEDTLRAVMKLCHIGAVAPVQLESEAASARPHTDALNTWLCSRRGLQLPVGVLASPVLGGGFTGVSPLVRALLNGVRQGLREATELALHAQRALSDTDQAPGRMTSPGVSDSDRAALIAQAGGFLESYLPLLRAVQIA